MTNRQRQFISLIKILPPLVMIIYSFVYLSGQFKLVVKNAHIIAAEEISNSIDANVSIDKINIYGTGSAVAEGIRITRLYEGKKEQIIAAKSINVKYNLYSLLFKKVGAQSVSSIEIIDPDFLLVRRKDGTFNIQGLLKPRKKAPGPPFNGKVFVRNARIIYNDNFVVTSKTTPLRFPTSMAASNVNACISGNDYPVYKMQAQFRGLSNKSSNASFSVKYNAKTRRVKSDIHAKDFSVPFITTFIRQLDKYQIQGGMADIEAGVEFVYKSPKDKAKKTLPLVYNLFASVKDCSLSIPFSNKRINNVNGSAISSGRKAFLSATADSAGSAVKVTGGVDFLHKPQVNLLFLASDINYIKASNALNFSRPFSYNIRNASNGSMQMRVFGPLHKPFIEANVWVPSIKYTNYVAKDLSAGFSYYDKVLDISTASFKTYGGDIQLTGYASFKKDNQKIDIQGNARNLDAKKLPFPAVFNMTGSTSADIKILGTTKLPKVSMLVRFKKGDIETKLFAGKKQVIPFKEASGLITIEKGVVGAKGLHLYGIAGGDVSLSGDILNKNMNIAVSLSAMDMKTIAGLFSKPNITGTAYFCGKVTGEAKNPRISGIAEVFNAEVQGYNVGYARADLEGDKKSLEVKESVIMHFPSELKLSGTFNNILSKRISFSANAKIARISVEEILKKMNRKFAATGTLVGDLDISGVYITDAKRDKLPLDRLSGTGNIEAENGTIFGYPITNGIAKVSIKDNVLHVDEAVVSSDEAVMDVTGSVALDKKLLDLQFMVADFDMLKIRDRVGKYANLAGTGQANGYIKGIWSDPNINFDASVKDLVINGNKMDSAIMNASYSEGIVSDIYAELKEGSQSLTFKASDYNPADNTLASGNGSLTNLSLKDLYETLIASPFLASSDSSKIKNVLSRIPRVTGGHLDGTFSINGKVTKPEGTLKLRAADVGLDVRKIDSVVADMEITGGRINLKDLTAIAGDTNLTASGYPLYEDGKTNLELSIMNLDISRLSPWLGNHTPRGMLAADFQVDGNVKAPHVKGSIEIVDPGYKSFGIERIRASSIEITDNKIDLNDGIIFAVEDHQALITGHLPWDWGSFSIPKDKPMEMTASIDKQQLSLLSAFTSAINKKDTSGIIDGNLHIAGIPSKPEMDGFLKIVDGKLSVSGVTNKFEKINADMLFDGTKVLVNKFQVESSKGGRVYVQPGGYINVADAGHNNINLLVAADNFKIGEKNIFAYQENVELILNAGVSITGSLADPLIADAKVGNKSGGIAVSDASVSFLVPPDMPVKKPLLPPIDPRFDLSIKLGKNVIVSPPSMSLLAGGGGTLTGKLSNMDLNLEVDVKGGNLRLATSRLRMIPGGKIYMSYAPAQVRADFKASTSVTATNQFGQRERYIITISVSGNVNDMKVDLKSSPDGLTREQMLASLGHMEGIFSSGETQIQKELGNVLTAVGSSTIFAPLESLFVDKFGFEQFSVDYGGTSPLSFYVSRRLLGNFFVSYYRRLNSSLASVKDMEYELSFEYRLSGNYHFNLGIDDQQTTSFEFGVSRAF